MVSPVIQRASPDARKATSAASLVVDLDLELTRAEMRNPREEREKLKDVVRRTSASSSDRPAPAMPQRGSKNS